MLTCPACGRANPGEASFCMGCGGPLGATATAHETRKTVTALFCDLVGSTTLGERYDPEVLRPLLHAYFEQMRAAVERHGGRVEKFIGDAVNAVFGLPVSHEDDALRAVRAAMEMTERVAGLAADGPIPLACRIGVNTGEVLVPAHGEPLIGDAMNTAARLQSSADPGSVVIGEPTWRLVRDAVVADPLEALVLKGKAAPVAAYIVRQVASGSPMRARRLDTPMVARRREASLLEDAFERAASDRACVLFTVLGTAGAGKSRLVEEFLGAHAGGGAEILRGRCLSYGDGITWQPVTEALRGALDLPEFAEADAIRSVIAAAVAGEEHAAALAANLAPLFAVGTGGTAEETAWAIRRFLESRGRANPLVLVLDDIHWGEPAFLDLVEHVADWSRGAAILLLCMARPDLLDVRPAWGGGKTNATTISLAPLSTTETDALIDGLLGSSALPLEVRSRITQVAEGNPLFVEEMLRMLVDDGRLVRDDGGWAAAGDLAAVTVPPTVSALLAARLDRLSEPERAVIEAASVAGKEFHRGAVAALLPETARADLAVHLRSLTRKELVTPERSSLPGEDAYRFRHLLIRDAAYDEIPKSARSALHRAFADWLEGVAGDRIAEQQELLGYHLERAHRYREELGLPEDREVRLRAGKALGAAGMMALDRGEVDASVKLLSIATNLVLGDRSELDILDSLAASLRVAGDALAASETESMLAAAAVAHHDPVFNMRSRFLAYFGEVAAGSRAWDLHASTALCREAAEVFRTQGADRFLPETVLWQANVAWERGDSSELLDRARETLVLTVGPDSRTAGSSAGTVIAALELGPQPLSVALAETDRLLESHPSTRWLEIRVRVARAGLEIVMGQVEAALTDMSAVLAMATDLQWPAAADELGLTRGWLAWLEGNLDEAEARLAEAIVAMEKSGMGGLNTVFAAHPLARILLDRGRDTDAAAVIRALDERFGPSYRFSRVPGLSLGGVLAARRGDEEAALRLSDDALALVATMDFVTLQGDVALDRAEILQLAGRPAEARASAQDALERFERKEHAIGIRRARAFLATLDAAPGTELA